MASFGPIAPYYDILMANVPYGMWAGYYRLLLARIGAQPDTILDVCCGTGSVTECLALEGYAVTGIDLSAGMIDEAKRKAASKGLAIRYEVADVRSFDLGTKFDSVCSFFDSFNYIAEAEGLRAAIGRVSSHLRPGGTFVFDVNTSYAFEKRMFDQHDHRRSARIHYDWKGEYDPETRIIRVHMHFKKGDVEFEEVHVQRAHAQEEIQEFLSEAGFSDVWAYDSYTLDPVRKTSDRVHYLARLPA